MNFNCTQKYLLFNACFQTIKKLLKQKRISPANRPTKGTKPNFENSGNSMIARGFPLASSHARTPRRRSMAFGNKLRDLVNKTTVDCINSFVNRILTNPCFLLPNKGTKQALKLSLVFTFNDSVRIFKFWQVKSKLNLILKTFIRKPCAEHCIESNVKALVSYLPRKI